MKKYLILIICISSLIVIELILNTSVKNDLDVYIFDYELKDYILFGILISMLFTKQRKISLLFIAFYQLVVGSIYYSHLPSDYNMVLAIYHILIAPIIYYHEWIGNKLKIKT